MSSPDRSRAVFARPLSARPGMLLLAAGALCLGCSGLRLSLPDHALRLAYQLAGAFLTSATGLLAVTLVDAARRRPPPAPRPAPRSRRRLSPRLEAIKATLDPFRISAQAIDWRGGWTAVPVGMVLSAAALYALDKAWTLVPSPPPPPPFDAVAAGLLVAAAFPALVFERHLAAIPPRDLPEAPALSRLCRVLLLALLLLASASGLRWLGLSWAGRVEQGVDVLLGLIAGEFLLRNAAYVFLPLPPLPQRHGHADSFIAGLVGARRPGLAAIEDAMRREFGIDLARSWALDFLRRAFLPVLAGMACAVWLLTGVTALRPDERAIYQSFGRPVAVFGPGLHIHLPWPFGLLKPVEFGVVHETPIVFADEAASSSPDQAAEHAGIDMEGMAPRSSDRLWDAAHPSEASYVVANQANGRQSFEIVNIDLRVVYRIGLGDEAARQSAYNVAEPEAMIRSAAGRMLARHFARLTIDDVLGQNRSAFIRDFQSELQTRLTEMSSGVEIMAVVVEAIHPPAEAAASYQEVQAAAIRSVARISLAKAAAVHGLKEAQQTATQTADDAAAAAAERIDSARADLTLFDGDRQAHLAGGASFLFERRLDRLDRSLAGAPLVIVDHRILPAQAPVLDLRPSPAPAFTSLRDD